MCSHTKAHLLKMTWNVDKRSGCGLLWIAVDLLQVLRETGCWSRDGGRWQQVPLLQQVDHSQGLWGAGLEAHGSQGRAQLGWPRTNRWLAEGKTSSFNNSYQMLILAKSFGPNGHQVKNLRRYLLTFMASIVSFLNITWISVSSRVFIFQLHNKNRDKK